MAKKSCGVNREGTTGINAAGVQSRAAAYKHTHARILLLIYQSQVDVAMKDHDIAGVQEVGGAAVEQDIVVSIGTNTMSRSLRKPAQALVEGSPVHPFGGTPEASATGTALLYIRSQLKGRHKAARWAITYRQTEPSKLPENFLRAQGEYR